MADKEKKDKTQKKDAAGADRPKLSIWVWIVTGLVVIVLSGSGFVLGRLMADSDPQQPQDAEKKLEEQLKAANANTAEDAQESWFYDKLDSIVVNPDEPGATRFVRVGLILEMSAELNQEEAGKIIENKKPILINWLNLYFKGLSLSQMENERDMVRILSQICDGFNDIMFPDMKPQVKKVLIREFNIQ